MFAVVIALLAALSSTVRSRAELVTEVLALRHQLAVLRRQAPRRLRLRRTDRLLWILLSRTWSGWRHWVQIVSPDTVVRLGGVNYFCRAAKVVDGAHPVIIWNERALRRHLRRYLIYYHQWRTHLSLEKDAPIARAVQPPSAGRIVAVPHVGGLHSHYERRAA